MSCAVFGVLGFFMKRGGWPRPPVILALVLGEILERSFQISTRIHDGVGWLGRPIVLVLLVVIALTIFLAVRGVARQKLAGNTPSGEASEKNPGISLPVSLVLLLGFVYAAYSALAWPQPVRQFPLLIAVPGALLTLLVVARDTLQLRKEKSETGSWRVTWQAASRQAWLASAIPFFAYIFAMMGLTLLVGQKIAMPVFIAVYLLRWGHCRPPVAAAYALAAWAVLVIFYDRIMNLLFHPSYLALWLEPRLPPGTPAWLVF